MIISHATQAKKLSAKGAQKEQIRNSHLKHCNQPGGGIHRHIEISLMAPPSTKKRGSSTNGREVFADELSTERDEA